MIRRALVQVHLWTGLAIGLYVVAVCVTGSVLVFHEELGHAAQASLRRMPVATDLTGRPALTLDAAAEALARALPDARVLSLAPPQSEGGSFQAGVLSGGYGLAFVHPLSGEVVGPVAPGGAVVDWIHRLHANLLLAGRGGRLINGIGALLILLLAATGLFIWWPRPGAWRRALLLKRHVGWKRMVFDFHHVIGFWLLVPTVVLAFTGAYFTWPGYVRATIGWFSPIAGEQAPRSDVGRRDAGPASLDGASAAARRAAPGQHVVRIELPGPPAQPYTVVLAEEAGAPPRALTRVFVDRYTGDVLEVRPAGRRSGAGDVIASWLGPLHTGNFGGVGVKIIWALAGLAPALLFISGFLMWWHRVVQPRQRVSRRQEANSAGAN